MFDNIWLRSQVCNDTLCFVFVFKKNVLEMRQRGWDGGQECSVSFRRECGAFAWDKHSVSSVPSALFSCFLMITCCRKPDRGLRPTKRQTLLRERRDDPPPPPSAVLPASVSPPWWWKRLRLRREPPNCLKRAASVIAGFCAEAAFMTAVLQLSRKTEVLIASHLHLD